MASKKHFPGPWQVDDAEKNWIVTADDKQMFVAKVIPYANGRDTANAQLIAAAPELLAALKILYARTKEYYHDDNQTLTDALHFAFSIIEKSEGR